MSKPKKLYIYVGHEPINVTRKCGGVAILNGKYKKDGLSVRKALKRAYLEYMLDAKIEQSEMRSPMSIQTL